MSQQDVFHPRFSVKSSFKGNEIDVSDGRYATKAGKQALNAPKSQTCYAGKTPTPVSQPQARAVPQQGQYPVAAGRGQRVVGGGLIDATRTDPTDQDRKYWKGKTVVAEPQRPQRPQRQQRPVRVPVQAQPIDRQALLKQAEREIQIQKDQCQRRTAPQYEISLPAEAMNQEEFILELPEGVDLDNVVINVAAPTPVEEQEMINIRRKTDPRKLAQVPREDKRDIPARRAVAQPAQKVARPNITIPKPAVQQPAQKVAAPRVVQSGAQTPLHMKATVPVKQLAVEVNDTARDVRGRTVVPDNQSQQNRQYLKGNTVVQQSQVKTPSTQKPKQTFGVKNN